MLFPITFSIAKEKIVDKIPEKTKILSDLVPGDTSTYIYDTEKDYYDEYKKSYFAITMKKAGWDCLRHYEILANGCIPLFEDLENCPKNTLALFPKELVLQGKKLYESHFKIGITSEGILKYNELCEKLLSYTRNHLTTVKLADYVLEKVNKLDASKILFLSGDLNPDYLRCLTLHGFKENFGTMCHDFPFVPHIYKCDVDTLKLLYGKGITYANLLDKELHDFTHDDIVLHNLKNKYYDLIIYGSVHRGLPFIQEVLMTYDNSDIVFMCGEDIHHCSAYDTNFNFFIREIHDEWPITHPNPPI